jgi:hypothetical protein
VFANGTLYVPDARNGRVSQWRLQNGRIAYRGQSPLSYGTANRLCSIGNYIYYLYFTEGSLIQRITVPSNHVSSFGAALFTAPGLNPVFIPGVIACDPLTKSVYVASQVSVLRRYDADTGRLVWETAIPGVEPPRIEVVRSGLPRYTNPPGKSPLYVTSVVAAPRGQLIVQAGDPPIGAAPGFGSTVVENIRSIIVDAQTGRHIQTRTDLPRIDLASGDWAYGWPANPFPQVKIYRWR